MKTVLFLIICFFALNTNTLGQNRVKYFLTCAKIDTVIIRQSFDSSYSVFIKLKEPYIKEFKILTEKNIGKLLIVMKHKTKIVSAIIKGANPIGLISVNNLSDEVEAKRCYNILMK